MVAQEPGPMPRYARRPVPQQNPETRCLERGESRRESFCEPLSWAARWCGFALFGPSGTETQPGPRTGGR